MIRAVALAALLLATPALAQVSPKDGDLPRAGNDVVAAAMCPLIAEPVRFCGLAPEFVPVPQSADDPTTAVFDTPQGLQALAMIENIGRDDGLTVARLQGVALENLSQAAGVPVSDLPIIQRGTLIVGGMTQPNFVYRGTVDGQMYVYSNTIVLMAGSVAQFVTVERDVTTYSPRHRSVHLRFLEQMQVST